MADENQSARQHAPNLPMRLCEVLEKEFVAIHASPPATAGWLLEPGNINADLILELLLHPSQGVFPGAITTIRDKLERAGLNISAQSSTDPLFSSRVLAALNDLLDSGEMLYDPCLVDSESDAAQIAEALAQPALRRDQAGSSASTLADASGVQEHVLLNRLLLETAFPAAAVARADTVRLNRVFGLIHALRGPENVHSALCLSGGGIRSASFAMGVLQALARRGILPNFDYLSTVSGGGYIGSWLSTWIHRHPGGLDGVVAELSMRGQSEAGSLTRRLRPEASPMRFLRSYSHFLNPKAGLFSADTWSWIGIYLRNLSLNWLVIIPLMLLVLAVPRLYASLLYSPNFTQDYLFPWLVWIASLAAVVALVCVTVNRPSISDPVRVRRYNDNAQRPTRERAHRVMEPLKRQGWVVALGVAPIVLFAALITLLVWSLRAKDAYNLNQIFIWLSGSGWRTPLVLPYIALEHLAIWGELIVLTSWLLSISLVPSRDWSKRGWELLAMLVAGALTWNLVASLAEYSAHISAATDKVYSVGSIDIYSAHLFAVLAIPALMIAVLAGMTLFVGGVSKFRWIEDEDREWWGRFGAWALIVMIGWVGLSAVTIFGPPLLLEFPKIITGIGGLSGLIAVVLGKSSLTSATGRSGSETRSVTQTVLAVLGVNTLAAAAIVFFVVFLAFLSLLTTVALEGIVRGATVQAPDGSSLLETLSEFFQAGRKFSHGCGLAEPWPALPGVDALHDPQVHLEVVCQTPLPVTVLMVLVLLSVLALSSGLINLNKFSLHAAYRIRIVRTFLGASRRGERRPNPFTGFDPLDNVKMHELQPGLLREADISSLPRLVEALHQALVAKSAPAAALKLVEEMCSKDLDPYGVLASRLRNFEPGGPVLKTLQRDVLESLNRVLETTALYRMDAFRKLLIDADSRGADVDCYLSHGNVVFANRALLEAAFPETIKRYAFPPPPPHKLLHVLNLTLNLVRGRRLAWQERKAAPFAVSPLHAGSYYLGYREVRNYGGSNGISIGTAAAISGAAVSPNMGYSSSPVTALLLTLFNVRLGWWLGNPGIAGNKTYRRSEPRFSLVPLLEEALGLTNDQRSYVYLSDGGHFENLGLFEMVLRRCRLIVVSDAGADPDYQFDDLGNAIRKIQIDLGIPIEFPPMQIRKRRAAVDEDGRYCALGRIRYQAIDGVEATDGILICIKPAVYGKEPHDVLSYAAHKTQFPQEPTFDQFFGESQFESYRHLGEFETLAVCGGESGAAHVDKSWVTALVEGVCGHLGRRDEMWIKQWLDSIAEEPMADVQASAALMNDDVA